LVVKDLVCLISLKTHLRFSANPLTQGGHRLWTGIIAGYLLLVKGFAGKLKIICKLF